MTTATTPPSPPLLEVDARSRVTLPGKAGRRYLVHEHADGTLVLEPAVVLSALEVAYSASPELQAAVVKGRAHPELRRPRPARRDDV